MRGVQITAYAAARRSPTLDELVDGGRAARERWLEEQRRQREEEEARCRWGEHVFVARPSPHSSQVRGWARARGRGKVEEEEEARCRWGEHVFVARPSPQSSQVRAAAAVASLPQKPISASCGT